VRLKSALVAAQSLGWKDFRDVTDAWRKRVVADSAIVLSG
jgi:hypothetical protein